MSLTLLQTGLLVDDGRHHGVHLCGQHALRLQGQRGPARRGRHPPPRQDGQQPAAQIFQGTVKVLNTKHHHLFMFSLLVVNYE